MRTALTIAMLSLFAAVPAHAHDVETGPIMICDTQQQIERYVPVFDGNQEAAIKAVNAAESNPSACAMTNVAYVRATRSAWRAARPTATRSSRWRWVAVNTGAGFQLVQPTVFYTLVKGEGTRGLTHEPKIATQTALILSWPPACPTRCG